MAVRLGGSSLLQAWKSQESQCIWCKKVFLHTTEHAYKGCCSWSCLCRLRESEDNRRQGRRSKAIINTEEQALARIEVCKEKMAHYQGIYSDKSLSRKKRDSVYSSIVDWRCKLKDAERTLKILRGEIDEDDIDD